MEYVVCARCCEQSRVRLSIVWHSRNVLLPCRILAELPRSLSEVALPPGVSQAAMEGPVRFDN